MSYSTRFPSSVAFLLLTGVLLTSSAEAGYRLPWMYCVSNTVLQGWNGGYSHTGQMKYAYDFDLVEGQEVRAAQGGTVGHVKNNIPASSCCSTSSCANDANYVTLDHSDGKSTLYLHLKNTSVSVGNTVTRGQRLGASGKTGWTSCDAHLHYQRQEQGIWYTQSVTGYFDEKPSLPLSQGSSYVSNNYRSGDVCEWLLAPPADGAAISAVDPHRGVLLDDGIVDLIAQSPVAPLLAGQKLGINFRAPVTVEPVLFAPKTDDSWPAWLPNWNLHFRSKTREGIDLPLDTQLEGYAGQSDVRALLSLKESEGSMEQIDLVGERRLAGDEVMIWRWRNSAGEFLSAARVDPNGIVMIHVNTRGFGGQVEKSAAVRNDLLDRFLLPQLKRLGWTPVSVTK